MAKLFQIKDLSNSEKVYKAKRVGEKTRAAFMKFISFI